MNNKEAGKPHFEEKLGEKEEISPEGVLKDDDSAVEPLVGTLFDEKYLIGEFLGAGGFSRVYKATHIHLKKTVAIKFLHEHYAGDEEKQQRFTREARTISALCHPHIVGLHDYGYSSRKPYLVMNFVEGSTLAEYLARGRQFSMEECLQIVSQSCEALSAAHSQCIIHRDLKPENIMLEAASEKIEVRLVDFGVAKVVQPEGDSLIARTRTGEVLGTPSYMSPEQCQGFQLDARSDIYSLGCVAYELITGVRAFSAETALAVMLQHLNTMPRTFSCGAPSRRIPLAVEAVVFKALAKKPEDRFQSATEFKDAFIAACSGKRSSIQSVLSLLRSRTAARRDPYRLLKAFAVLLLVCLSAVVVTGLFLRKPHWLELLDEADKHPRHTAVKCLQEAWKEAKDRAPRSEQAMVVARLGDAVVDPKEGCMLYEQAVGLMRGSTDEKTLAIYLDRLSDAQSQIREYKSALASSKQAIDLAGKLCGEKSDLMRDFLLREADTYRRLHQFEVAEAVCNRSRAIEIEIGVPKSIRLGEIDWLLCKILLAQGKLPAAQKVFAEYTSIRKLAGDTEAEDSELSEKTREYERLFDNASRARSTNSKGEDTEPVLK